VRISPRARLSTLLPSGARRVQVRTALAQHLERCLALEQRRVHRGSLPGFAALVGIALAGQQGRECRSACGSFALGRHSGARSQLVAPARASLDDHVIAPRAELADRSAMAWHLQSGCIHLAEHPP